jgi:hypothetical protein
MFGLASARKEKARSVSLKGSFTDIMEPALNPSINHLFPDGSHRLMMDNDPKHTSHHVADYLRDQNINWWKTPAESPDLNLV